MTDRMVKLKRKFFEQNTPKVARELLGKTLVRCWRGRELRGIITETEAYKGLNDKASHASRGMTPRTALMFGEAGKAYVYLIYGMHHCLNVVTEKNGYPAAVLIRGVQSYLAMRKPGKILNGPGKVCKFFHIDKTLNGEDITKSRKLWIENVQSNLKVSRLKDLKIKRTLRIGVDYAKEWENKPWRFYINLEA